MLSDFREIDDYAHAIVKNVGAMGVGRILRVSTIELGYVYAQYQYNPNQPGSFITSDGAEVTPVSYRLLTEDEYPQFFERGFFQKKVQSS